jgi:protein-tyrosine-phosphatase
MITAAIASHNCLRFINPSSRWTACRGDPQLLSRAHGFHDGERTVSVRHHGLVVNVLFVCVGNQGRSVMAERLFARAVNGLHQARSAGSAPGSATHRVVLDALAEVGIDASDHVPARLDDERVAWADVVVATCDDACPVVPGKRYVSWQLPDPKGRQLDEVRAIRDDISRRVEALADELPA